MCCSSASSLWSLSAAGTQEKVSSTVSMGKRGNSRLHTIHIQVCSRAQSRLTRSSLIRNWCQTVWKRSLSCFQIPSGKRCTRLSKSDIRVQIVHSDHNAPRGNDDEEDVKEPMVSVFADCTWATDLRCDGLGSLYGSRSNSSDMLGVPSGSQQQ